MSRRKGPVAVSHTRGNFLARWGLLGRTRVPETPEFEAAVRLYEDAKRTFKGIAVDSEKLGDAANEHARSHFELTQMLSGIAFEREQPAVAAFVETEKRILENMDGLSQNFHKLFIAPMAVLMEGEIRECTNAKKAYDKSKKYMERHLRALNCCKGFGNQEKIVASENAFYIAEQRYLYAKQEFLMRLQALETKKRQIFEENMRVYLDMQAAALEQNIALLEAHPEFLQMMPGGLSSAPLAVGVGAGVAPMAATLPVGATVKSTSADAESVPIAAAPIGSNLGMAEGVNKAMWDNPALAPSAAVYRAPSPVQQQFTPIAPAPVTASGLAYQPAFQRSSTLSSIPQPEVGTLELVGARQVAMGDGVVARAMQQTLQEAQQSRHSPLTVQSGVIPPGDMASIVQTSSATTSEQISGHAAHDQPIQHSLLAAGVGTSMAAPVGGVVSPVGAGVGSVPISGIPISVPMAGGSFSNAPIIATGMPVSVPSSSNVPLSLQQQQYVQQSVQRQLEQHLNQQGYTMVGSESSPYDSTGQSQGSFAQQGQPQVTFAQQPQASFSQQTITTKTTASSAPTSSWPQMQTNQMSNVGTMTEGADKTTSKVSTRREGVSSVDDSFNKQQQRMRRAKSKTPLSEDRIPGFVVGNDSAAVDDTSKPYSSTTTTTTTTTTASTEPKGVIGTIRDKISNALHPTTVE